MTTRHHPSSGPCPQSPERNFRNDEAKWYKSCMQNRENPINPPNCPNLSQTVPRDTGTAREQDLQFSSAACTVETFVETQCVLVYTHLTMRIRLSHPRSCVVQVCSHYSRNRSLKFGQFGTVWTVWDSFALIFTATLNFRFLKTWALEFYPHERMSTEIVCYHGRVGPNSWITSRAEHFEILCSYKKYKGNCPKLSQTVPNNSSFGKLSGKAVG